MTWRGFAKGLLFCAGMIGGLAAGSLFYLERYWPGAAMFALTGLFLFFAMTDLKSGPRNADQDGGSGGEADLQKAVSDLALLVAENAINGAKRIGRTMPCTPKELAQMEEELTAVLNSLSIGRKERERLEQEFEKLRTRSRQDEGRRALIGSRF